MVNQLLLEDKIGDERRKKSEYMRKYNATDKGKEYNRRHVKEWRKKNPKASHSKNRISSSKAYREDILNYLVERDGSFCGFCGGPLTLDNCHIDHIKAVSLGGLNRMENFRLSHVGCNIRSGHKIRKEAKGY